MKDFEGFRFGPYHSSDLHLKVTSSGDRFIKNTLPTPTDYTTDIAGGDGKYYFGQTFGTREFTVNVAFEDLDETTWRRISQIFSTDKLQDLVFDENPYKTYRAKCQKQPDFKYVCFRDKDTGKRVYKGEGTFTFICYHPLAFGFNKYVVRAADYYKYNTPQQIIEDKTHDRSKYNPQVQEKKITGIQKDHYNTNKNMGVPWKGGYPTIEQVQFGELFFNGNGHSAEECEPPNTSAPPANSSAKMILDVRGYWDNIPRWEDAAKLLTTPTLDYEQELIYCPQYNKLEFYNMDLGLNKLNSIIGSRILVYNPGDVPVDFTLKLGNLTQHFRDKDEHYTFRVSRYNVQRLTIQQAVDWTGLKPYDLNNEEDFKYGSKYFSYLTYNGTDFNYKDLNLAHPNHCYIVEPIPQEKLGYFIRLFYWQSNLMFNKMTSGMARPTWSYWDDTDWEFYPDGIKQDIYRHILNHEEGEAIAARYEELREQCITDDERNQLYWETLKTGILDKYREINEIISTTLREKVEEVNNEQEVTEINKLYKIGDKYYINRNSAAKEIEPMKPWFDDDYTYDDFVYDFIYNPSEYVRYYKDTDYGEFNFNISHTPQFMTFDYFDINDDGFEKIPYAQCGCSNDENKHKQQILPLYLDSDKHLLYYNEEPKWEMNKTWLEHHEDKQKNFYNFKTKKNILNNNIERGHWFKLPPGWSMIDVSPLIDDAIWGSKLWMDARPFDWGTTKEEHREKYNECYRAAAVKYLASHCPDSVIEKYENEEITYPSDASRTMGDSREQFFDQFEVETLEDYLQFRRWYKDEWELKETAETKVDTDNNDYGYKANSGSPDYVSNKYYIAENDDKIIDEQTALLNRVRAEILRRRAENAEIGFLKLLAVYWRAYDKKDTGGLMSWSNADVSDWWWYANSYIWANFPPLYWGYADLLNKAEIDFIPQFY